MATRAGGTATVVDDGESGFLEAVGDTDALAGQLAGLASDPELRSTLGRHGAADVRARFATGRMADELDAVYREALDAMKVVHVHKLTGVSGSENHLLALLPALRAAASMPASLGLDVPGRTRRGSTNVWTSGTSPTGACAAASTSARAWRVT